MSVNDLISTLCRRFSDINILLTRTDPKQLPYKSKYKAFDKLIEIEKYIKNLPYDEKREHYIELCDFDAALHTLMGYICVETDEHTHGISHLYPAFRYFLVRNGYKSIDDVPVLVEDPDFDIFSFNNSWTQPKEEEWSGLLNCTEYEKLLENIESVDSVIYVKVLPFVLLAANYMAILLSNRGNRETSYNILHFIQDELIKKLILSVARSSEVVELFNKTLDLNYFVLDPTDPQESKKELDLVKSDNRILTFKYTKAPTCLIPDPQITVIQFTYTHTLYFLAQVSGDLKKTNESSHLCCQTLLRQYQSDYNSQDKDGKIAGTISLATDWINNALDLHNFYIEKHCFKEAKALLYLCKSIWNKCFYCYSEKAEIYENVKEVEQDEILKLDKETFIKNNPKVSITDIEELRARFYHENGKFLIYFMVTCINYKNEAEAESVPSNNFVNEIKKSCDTVHSYDEAMRYILLCKPTKSNANNSNVEEQIVEFVDSDDETDFKNICTEQEGNKENKKDISVEEYVIESILLKNAGDLQLYSSKTQKIDVESAKKIEKVYEDNEINCYVDESIDELIPTKVPYLSKSGATSIYEKALWYMNEALKFFVLDGYVTPHVQIKLDISNMHDLYCNYCKDSQKTIGVIQKQRANLVSELIPKLSIEHYREHLLNLRSELAEANEAIFDSRFERMTEKVKNKISNIAEDSFSPNGLNEEDKQSLAIATNTGFQAITAWSYVALALEGEAKMLLMQHATTNEARKKITDMKIGPLVNAGIPEDIKDSLETALFKMGRIMFKLPLIDIERRVSAMEQAMQCFEQIISLKGQLKSLAQEMHSLLKVKIQQMKLLKQKMDSLKSVMVKPGELIIDSKDKPKNNDTD